MSWLAACVLLVAVAGTTTTTTVQLQNTGDVLQAIASDLELRAPAGNAVLVSLAQLSADSTDARQRLATVEDTLSGLPSKSQLEDAVEAGQKVAGVMTDVSALQAKATGLATDLQSEAGRVDDLVSDLAALEQSVEPLHAGLSKSLAQEIVDVRTTVNSLKDDLANGALAGVASSTDLDAVVTKADAIVACNAQGLLFDGVDCLLPPALVKLNQTLQESLKCARSGLAFDGTSCVSAKSQDPLCFGLEAYYQFESDVTDATHYSRDGTVTSGSVSYTSGVVGSGASFNGGTVVSVNAFKNYNWGSELSVSLWFKRSSSGGYQGIVTNGYGTSGAFEVRMGDETTSQGHLFGGGFNSQNDVTTWDFDFAYVMDEVWHHAVMTFDGEVARLFVDNKEMAYRGDGRDEKGALKSPSDLPLFIGAARADLFEPFRGVVDEVRIYSRPLRQSEVSTLFYQRQPTVCEEPDGLGSFSQPARSCRAIQAAGKCHPDTKTYWLIRGTSDKFLAHCDCKEDGGGWTLVLDVQHQQWTNGNEAGDWSATMSIARQQSVFADSDHEFRFTSTDGSGRKLFIKDDQPTHLNPTSGCSGSAHTWQTLASSVQCKVTDADTYKVVSSKSVNCCSTVVGSHTCGQQSGWILFHLGNTYNCNGNHPCPSYGSLCSETSGHGSMNKLWLR